MTDHTPSPATDGLRARLIEALTDAHNPTLRPGVTLNERELRMAYERVRALLADPAPEAAREVEQRADHFEHLYRQASEGRCGHSGLTIPACKASICDCFEFPWVKSESPGHDCATCEDCIHDGHRCCGCYDGSCCKNPTPADLPVATGVTTEGDGCECVGYTIRTDYGTGVEYDVDRSSCPLHPAPAPVVSAGDEGLSEALTKAIDDEWLRPEHDCDGTDRQCAEQCPRPAYQRMGLDELRDAAVAAAQTVLAARVAEAEARALRDAADGFDPAILEGVVDMSTSAFRQGAAAAWSGAERFLRDRADQIEATQ